MGVKLRSRVCFLFRWLPVCFFFPATAFADLSPSPAGDTVFELVFSNTVPGSLPPIEWDTPDFHSYRVQFSPDSETWVDRSSLLTAGDFNDPCVFSWQDDTVPVPREGWYRAEQVGIEAVALRGRVLLPLLHPRNLYHQMMRSTNHMHALMGHSQAAPRDFNYEVVDPMTLSLDRLLEIVAVPVPPPPGAQSGFGLCSGTNEDPGFPLGEQVSGVVNPDGSFEIWVPPYPHGYFLACRGGRVRLKTRFLAPVLPGPPIENIMMDIQSTLLANVALELGEEMHQWPDPRLVEALGQELDARENGIQLALQDSIGSRAWRLAAKELAAGLPSSPGSSLGTSATLTYIATNEVYYNLMSGAEMSGTVTRVSFGLFPGQRIRDQYLASAGVRFLAPRRLFFPMPFKKLFGIRPNTRVTEGFGGVLEVSRPTLAADNILNIVFTGTVHSVGMHLQNGFSMNDTTGVFPRRPFRFVAYDAGGSLLHEYKWYTSQTTAGGGFFGLTSPDPIRRIRIEMAGTADFSLDDLMFSDRYSHLPDLGWRADGNWVQKTTVSNSFSHIGRPVVGHSGSSYWTCPYGVTVDPEGSKLTAPAYTLTNIDLDYDDIHATDVWLLGVTSLTSRITASMGTNTFDFTENSACRIPSGACGVYPWNMLDAATMQTHWSHVHWQGYVGVETNAVVENTSSTGRYVEYSTDNGATWRNAYWFEDVSHHGKNGVWWNNHMHPFQDSDLNGDANRDGVIQNTDFDKDGVADYDFDVDGDGAGAVGGDPDDIREWDTEFYWTYVPPPWTDVDSDGLFESDIEGTSISYRFRFFGPKIPASCGSVACDGWSVDDVSFNNDDLDVGYFTDFDRSMDPNQ